MMNQNKEVYNEFEEEKEKRLKGNSEISGQIHEITKIPLLVCQKFLKICRGLDDYLSYHHTNFHQIPFFFFDKYRFIKL